MELDRWEQIERLYHAALEREPNVREAFLDEACAGEEGVRREVAGLLACDVPGDSFIQSPAIEIAARAMAAEPRIENSTNPTRSPIAAFQIGVYKLLEPLGRGGMGEVHLALDTRLGRKVALKLLPAAFTADTDRVQRFAREARAASALNHPNIITIHEIGETAIESESLRYIVTEYVEGETLRQRMASAPQRRMKPSEAIDIAGQIAAALSAAHEAGITHRDIKPENVMVRPDGLVKVLDFGLAKLTPPASEAIDTGAPTLAREISTTPGMILGTLRYMSPEQARAQEVDARSDIFSLGAVLYEMIAGEPLFAGGTTADIIAAIINKEPQPLAEFTRESSRTGAALDRIVRKALRKDLEERYQTAGDMLSDLKNLKEELMIADRGLRIADSNSSDARRKDEEIETLPANALLEAPAPPLQGRLSRLARTLQSLRHRGVMWGSLVAVLFVIGASFWLVQRFRPRPTADWRYTLQKSQLVSLKSIGGDSLRSGRFSPEGNLIVYTAPGSGSNLWLAQIGGDLPFQISKEQLSVTSPIWSPDGQQIAFISNHGGQLGVWTIPAFGITPNLIKTLEIEGKLPELKNWSRSGAIFYEWKRNFYALSSMTKEIVRVTNFGADVQAPREFNLSPDETTIAYVDTRDKQDDIWIVDRRGGAPRRVTNDPATDSLPVWHPDGRRLLYTSERDGIERICVAYIDGGQPEQITFEDGDCYVSDVSVDGKKILYYTSKDDADLWEVDVESGQKTQLTSDFGSELWPSISHDGAKIAFQAIKGPNVVRKINNARILTKSLNAGASAKQLSADGYAPQLSPDGLKVGFLRLVDGRDELWVGSVDSGQTQVVTNERVIFSGFNPLPSLLYQSKDFCWSPNSRLIAYSSRKDGTANIWTITSDGAQATKVSANDDPDRGITLTCPIWAPDGRRLVYIFRLPSGKDGRPATWQL